MAPSRAASPLVAALLSGLFPGVGQWYAGRRRRAWVFIFATLLAVVPASTVLILVLVAGGPSLAVAVTRPFFEHPVLLLGLLGANVAALAFRFVAVVDAYLVAGGSVSRRQTIVSVMVIALLIGIIAVPHVWAARRNLALYDLFTYDFSTDPRQVSTTATNATTTTLPAATTTAATTTTTTTTTAPTTTIPATTTTLALEDRRVNVLLLGGDAGPDRTGIRTDTILVASIDPVTGWAALLALPRNVREIPIPADHPAYDVWDCHCYPDLVNALYQTGLRNPGWFPEAANSGAAAVTTIIGNLFDMTIDHYVLVDMLGFVEVVDALGGVTVEVTAGVYDDLYTRPEGEVVPVEFPPGTYHMDGEEALSYARVRRGTSDYDRMGRQRCLLDAIAAEADPITLVQQLPDLVPALQDTVVTDIPVSEWPNFIELAAAIDTGSVVSVRFMPHAPELAGTGTSYTAGFTAGGYPLPNVDLIRQTVHEIISSPPLEAAQSLGIEPLSEICGTG